jgi:hypothetical protein
MVKVHMPNPRRASKRLAVLYFALLGIATVYSFFEYLEYGHDIFDSIALFFEFGGAKIAIAAILLLPLLIASTLFGEWHRHIERRRRKGSHEAE